MVRREKHAWETVLSLFGESESRRHVVWVVVNQPDWALGLGNAAEFVTNMVTSCGSSRALLK